MKKNFAKKVLAMALAATCIIGMVGCGNSAKATDVLMTVNDENVSYGVANFYLRMQQGTYETYYSSFLGEDMWNQSLDGSISFGESTVSSVVDDLKEMVILSQHAKDYDVALTEEEKAAIEKAADSFIADNEEETIEVMSADREVIVDYLTVYTISQKMQAAIKAEADTEVSDEEAAESEKAEIVEERQSELYDTTYAKWLEESNVTENKDVREKLVINGTVTIKDDEAAQESAATVDEVVDDVNEALSE